MLRTISLILVLTATTGAHASIYIDSISGVSNATITNPNTVQNPNLVTPTNTVYGGTAGADCTGSGSPCNSCAAAAAGEVCSLARISGSSTITMTLHSDSIAGLAVAGLVDNTNTAVTITTGQAVGANQQTTLTVSWGAICNSSSMGLGSTCNGGAQTASFSVGLRLTTNNTGTLDDYTSISFAVDDAGYNTSPTQNGVIGYCGGGNTITSGGGVCAFEAFPGDNRIYLTPNSVLPGPQFPNTNPGSSLTASQLIMFYSKDGFTMTPATASKTFSLQASTTGSTSVTTQSDHVDGFDNNTFYFFRMGVADLAQNVSWVTSDAAITSACGTNALTLTGATVTDADDIACPFIAKPDQVLGLLTKDFNCFIATAAYGSSLDAHLKTFRQFRSFILLRSEWGKKLNALYYRFGPYGARWIQAHPWVKPWVRIVLWPTWWYADLSLRHGVGRVTGAVALILFLLLGGLARVWRAHDH